MRQLAAVGGAREECQILVQSHLIRPQFTGLAHEVQSDKPYLQRTTRRTMNPPCAPIARQNGSQMTWVRNDIHRLSLALIRSTHTIQRPSSSEALTKR
jgi:hypothetical protein